MPGLVLLKHSQEFQLFNINRDFHSSVYVDFSLSLSAVCRESVCQDMSLAVLSDDPKVSVFKCHIGAILREK